MDALTQFQNYFEQCVDTFGLYDLQHTPDPDPSTDNGWKISIQGRSTDDSRELVARLAPFLIEQVICFKVATAKRYALQQDDRADLREQGTKAMTIYCPDSVNFDQLCQCLRDKLIGYTGGSDIQTQASYQRYADGMFIRCAKDADGQYISAH